MEYISLGSFLNIILGNSKSLWNAVNVAKNVDCNKIPPKMRDGEDDIANKKSWKTAEKNVSNSFQVLQAPESWSKYTTDVTNRKLLHMVTYSIV